MPKTPTFKLKEYQVSLQFNLIAYANLLQSIREYEETPKLYEKQLQEAMETKEKLETMIQLDKCRIQRLEKILARKSKCSMMGGFRTRRKQHKLRKQTRKV